jgi:hypothetical protein
MKEETVGVYTIKVKVCEESGNPRDWGGTTRFVFSHKRYRLPMEIENINHKDYRSWDELLDGIRQEAKSNKDEVLAAWKVYMLDHSSTRIAIGEFGDPFSRYHMGFDSGCIGWCVVLRSDLIKTRGWKRITKERKEQLLEIAKGEIELYDKWINGEVYYAAVYDGNGDFLDSFGDYYDVAEALQAGKESIQL